MSQLSNHRVLKHPLPVQHVNTASGESIPVKEDHVGLSLGHNIVDQFAPLGSTVIFQNSGTKIEFQVFATRINEVKMFLLEIPIANNHETDSLELISPYFFCTVIEILIDNNVAQEIYPEGNLFAHRTMTNEQSLILTRMTNLLNEYTLTGRDADGLNPILIPPQTTRYVYLPLNNTLFEQTKVPFASISSTIRFRFTFDTFTNVTASTNLMSVPANLAANSPQLYCIGSAVSGPGSDVIRNLVAQNYSANYYKQERQVISNALTTPGQKPKQSLTNLNGTYSSICVMLRKLGPTKELTYQWDFTNATNPNRYQIWNLTLYDSNGSAYSINSLGYFLSKWQSSLITGCNGSGTAYSNFSDKFAFVQFDLADSVWNSIRQGNPGGITINNAWSIEYEIGNQGPYISRYAASAFPGDGENTETVVIADRLYSIMLESNGRLRFMSL